MAKELSLFAGAGGGLIAGHLLGWDTVQAVEWDPFCQQVLAARFPELLIHGDADTFDGRPWRGKVDVVSAGFPCQAFSVAGKREGETSPKNKWPATARILGEALAPFVFLENVPGLLHKRERSYFRVVLRDLARLGYDLEWDCLPASAVGAPHLRYRLFVVCRLVGRPLTPRWQEEPGNKVPRAGAMRDGVVSAHDPVSEPKRARRIPTPDDHANREPGENWPRRRRGHIPTPVAQLGNDDERPETWQARRAEAARVYHNNGRGEPLVQWVKRFPTFARLFPPPIASDDGDKNPTGSLHMMVREGRPHRGAGPWLHPGFSEWLMGWPVGWTDPDVDPDVETWARATKDLTWWDEERSPRVYWQVPDRVRRRKRLRAIGNGQVPLQVQAAVEVLAERLGSRP